MNCTKIEYRYIFVFFTVNVIELSSKNIECGLPSGECLTCHTTNWICFPTLVECVEPVLDVAQRDEAGSLLKAVKNCTHTHHDDQTDEKCLLHVSFW